jgi:hypothetical protein
MDTIDANYIFWYCALDEGFNASKTGLFVDRTVPADSKGQIALYKQYKNKYIHITNEDSDDEDNSNNWKFPALGEVGLMTCNRLEKGQILIAFYDDYGGDGQVIVNELTNEIKEYLDKYSFDNEECRRKPCRSNDAFYSFAFDWEGNVIYRSPLSTADKETREYYDTLEDDKCPIQWKLIELINLNIYGDKKFKLDDKTEIIKENIEADKVVESRKYRDLSIKSLCNILVELKQDKTSLFCKLPKDIFNLLFQLLIEDYQVVHFIRLVDPIIPSYNFSWKPQNRKEMIFFTTPIDNDKIYITMWIENEIRIHNNTSTYEMTYLKGNIRIESTNNELKLLYMSSSSSSLLDKNFSLSNNETGIFSVSFSSCICAKVMDLKKIDFNLYYNV